MSAEQRVVIVGGGFGGTAVARRLEQLLPPSTQVTIVNPETAQLFTPLLSMVAAGVIEPRHALVPLRRSLRRTAIVRGSAQAVDLDARTVTVAQRSGDVRALRWDRLVLAPGSVSRPAPRPMIAARPRVIKTLSDAIALRAHVVEQIELAEATDDPAERRRRLTFVVVGGGYAGTEITAELQSATTDVLPFYPMARRAGARWILLQRTDGLLPQLGDRLGSRAGRLLVQRGVDVRLRTTIAEAGPGWIELSDHQHVPTETVIWTAGVSPQPWVGNLPLPVDSTGRLIVDRGLAISGATGVYALGDAARVPMHTEDGGIAPPTATHATRQGLVCADNIAASFGAGAIRHHRHHDRSLYVNLGHREGVAMVAGLPATGYLGWLATFLHRVHSLPAGNRRRVAFDWMTRSGSIPHLAATPSAAFTGAPTGRAVDVVSAATPDGNGPAGHLELAGR